MPGGSQASPGADADALFETAWRRFRLAAGAVLVVVLAGSVGLTRLWAAHGAPQDRPGTSSGVMPRQLPHDQLSGVGATPSHFRAAHGTALPRGGFGPVFVTNGGDDVPSYDIGNSSNPDMIDDLIHSFRPGISQAQVLAAVTAHDLPADARLAATSMPGATCKVLTYRSTMLASAGPYEDFGDGTVRITLVSKLADPSAEYTAANVEQADEQVSPTVPASCD